MITFSFSFCVWPQDCNKSLLLPSDLLLLMTCKVTIRASCTGNTHRSDSCSRADSAMARAWLELFQRMTKGRNGKKLGIKNQWRAVKVQRRSEPSLLLMDSCDEQNKRLWALKVLKAKNSSIQSIKCWLVLAATVTRFCLGLRISLTPE